jgi:hypothetical protein
MTNNKASPLLFAWFSVGDEQGVAGRGTMARATDNNALLRTLAVNNAAKPR